MIDSAVPAELANIRELIDTGLHARAGRLLAGIDETSEWHAGAEALRLLVALAEGVNRRPCSARSSTRSPASTPTASRYS